MLCERDGSPPGHFGKPCQATVEGWLGALRLVPDQPADLRRGRRLRYVSRRQEQQDRSSLGHMRVVIAGGHGKVALRLERILSSRGDQVVGLVRNADHLPDLERAGAAGAVVDLEGRSAREVANVLTGADAVVFAAGAGPGSGAARKDTVDRGAAVLLADAAVIAGVRRYLLVSSTGVDRDPSPDADEVWAAYLRAKKAAEVEVAEREVDLTILRPGPLSDDPGVGRVTLAAPGQHRRTVSRDDVAAVLAALLAEPAERTNGLILELMGGETPIEEAVASALKA